MPVLDIRKLSTSEDHGFQEALGQLERADVFAREIVMVQAIPDHVEPWARILEAVDHLSDTEAPDNCDREEWAYLLGVAVGLKLAGLQGGVR
jgi:hypothetical protein